MSKNFVIVLFLCVGVVNAETSQRAPFPTIPVWGPFESQSLNLLKGEGVPVCESYKKNFGEQKYKGGFKPRCHARLTSGRYGIVLPSPKLIELAVAKNMLPILYPFVRDPFAQFPLERADYVDYLKRRFDERYGVSTEHIIEFEPKIDFNNDGLDDDVVLWTDGDCASLRPVSVRPFVFNSDRTGLNLEVSRAYFAALRDRQAEHKNGGHSSDWGRISVFKHDGISYYDYLDTQFASSYRTTIDVYKTSGSRSHLICRFRAAREINEQFNPNY